MAIERREVKVNPQYVKLVGLKSQVKKMIKQVDLVDCKKKRKKVMLKKVKALLKQVKGDLKTTSEFLDVDGLPLVELGG